MCIAMATDGQERRTIYRALFSAHLDALAIADIRLALNQGQPLGSSRFLAQIEEMIGILRQVKPRGRARKSENAAAVVSTDQPDRAL